MGFFYSYVVAAVVSQSEVEYFQKEFAEYELVLPEMAKLFAKGKPELSRYNHKENSGDEYNEYELQYTAVKAESSCWRDAFTVAVVGPVHGADHVRRSEPAFPHFRSVAFFTENFRLH